LETAKLTTRNLTNGPYSVKCLSMSHGEYL